MESSMEYKTLLLSVNVKLSLSLSLESLIFSVLDLGMEDLD
jgi:hypothetical protein